MLAREWFYEFTLPSGAVTRPNFVGLNIPCDPSSTGR